MADTTNRLAGIVYLSVDGTSYPVAGDAAYAVSGVERTTEGGQDSIHGFSEKPVPGSIEANLRDSGGLTIADLNAMTNVTVMLELASGKIIVGRNMWTVGKPPDVNTTDATLKVRWEGPDVQEI